MTVCFLVPVYNSVKFLPKLFYHLSRLNPKPDMTFFAENNSTDGTLNYVVKNCRLPFKVIRICFRPDAVQVSANIYDPMGHVRQLLLTAARHYDPDFAVFLDADVYPLSADLIPRLTSWNEDIVGGLYLKSYPQGIFAVAEWACLNGKYVVKKKDKVRRPLDAPYTVGAGCMCLRRRVIQDRRLTFTPVPNSLCSEDGGFCRTARLLGYQIFLDSEVKLHHDYLHSARDRRMWTRTDEGQIVPFTYS